LGPAAAPAGSAWEAPAPGSDVRRVVFATELGAVPVEVEVVTTPEGRARGLMFRERLDPGKGMLFVFPHPEVHRFWMKNTLIPLDMVHLDEERFVVGIVVRAEPKTLAERSIGIPSQYVVEVPGGWAGASGISVGTPARFENH
jgi:uncharacterized membrane protein (UPF0127 family)